MGAFTNYVWWVGGQKNATFTTVKVQTRVRTPSKNMYCNCIFFPEFHTTLAQCSKTVMTPPQKYWAN